MQLEKQIEGKVVKWAREHGILTRKMNGDGYRGWPDRLFVLRNGKTLWIEFKRPGGKESELQKVMLDNLRELGHEAHVYSDAVKAIECLRLHAELP